ncbi:MAG: VanZ family protein [Ferruginibacter sp.]
MKQIKFNRFIPAIAWFIVVMVLLCLPGDDVPSSSWFDVIYFDKWVHTGIFGLLALLFMLPFALAPIKNKEKLQYFIRIAIFVSLWGLTTEFIQKYLVPGRNFDLLDWAADSLGSFIALLICRKRYIKPSLSV